ncbi:MAG: hypothetical protein JRJ56_05200, partial [Deltaproteobacteria bacterium]|nr:hypothetical protein [Deltaproteobacteria bacterium]
SGFPALLLAGLAGSLRQVWHIALIVVPLMVVMQFLEELRVLEWLAARLARVVRFIGLSGHAAFPLVVGLTLGLAYGAGLIIHSSRQGVLNRREMVLIITFLSINHSMFEDTLLFVAIGANGWLLLAIRFVVATAFTALLARLLPPAGKEPAASPS